MRKNSFEFTSSLEDKVNRKNGGVSSLMRPAYNLAGIKLVLLALFIGLFNTLELKAQTCSPPCDNWCVVNKLTCPVTFTWIDNCGHPNSPPNTQTLQPTGFTGDFYCGPAPCIGSDCGTNCAEGIQFGGVNYYVNGTNTDLHLVGGFCNTCMPSGDIKVHWGNCDPALVPTYTIDLDCSKCSCPHTFVLTFDCL
jgi:hypothetical protein